MPEYWIIAGIGHCGTKWLSWVLGEQPGIIGLHEYKMSITGMPWDIAARYESKYGLSNRKYQPYFEAMDNALCDIVVDANSWSPALLQEVDYIKHIDRIIYIVRHGVSQLHSLTLSQVWASAKLNSFIYNRYLYPYFEFAGCDDPAGLDRWERLCLFWAGSVKMSDALLKSGLPVEVVTFEGLTQRQELRTIVTSMNNEEIVHYRGQDINRKVRGDRRPNTLWMQWTDRQRDVFQGICGEQMERLGYAMPGA